MITKKNVIKTIDENEKKIKQYGVKRIGLFGSVVKAANKKKSDIDILVEFKRGEKTFDNYMDLKLFLQKALHHKVDLVVREALKARIKNQILREVEYAGL